MTKDIKENETYMKIEADDLKIGSIHYISLSHEKNDSYKEIIKLVTNASTRFFEAIINGRKGDSSTFQIRAQEDGSVRLSDIMEKWGDEKYCFVDHYRLLSSAEGRKLEADKLIKEKQWFERNIKGIDEKLNLLNNEETTNEK